MPPPIFRLQSPLEAELTAAADELDRILQMALDHAEVLGVREVGGPLARALRQVCGDVSEELAAAVLRDQLRLRAASTKGDLLEIESHNTSQQEHETQRTRKAK